MLTAELSSKISGVGDGGGYGVFGSDFQSYLNLVVWALLQLIVLEVICLAVTQIASQVKKK
jgi:hypothetical protein